MRAENARYQLPAAACSCLSDSAAGGESGEQWSGRRSVCPIRVAEHTEYSARNAQVEQRDTVLRERGRDSLINVLAQLDPSR